MCQRRLRMKVPIHHHRPTHTLGTKCGSWTRDSYEGGQSACVLESKNHPPTHPSIHPSTAPPTHPSINPPIYLKPLREIDLRDHPRQPTSQRSNVSFEPVRCDFMIISLNASEGAAVSTSSQLAYLHLCVYNGGKLQRKRLSKCARMCIWQCARECGLLLPQIER